MMSKHLLSGVEARVIGCFLEKQITTPDQYPMSLNSVVTACNQKSNREPVMFLSENDVQNALDMLVKKHQLTAMSGVGNRVIKYGQRFCNSEFGQLKLHAAEVALITTLLLRGAQTAGELRIRSARMYEFSDVDEVEQALDVLSKRADGPWVMRVEREPGKRENRYMHLFSGQPEISNVSGEDPGSDLDARVVQLEQDVAQLRQQVARLLATRME
jgi:uncharacterized protein YceH (UPF0502 family)